MDDLKLFEADEDYLFSPPDESNNIENTKKKDDILDAYNKIFSGHGNHEHASIVMKDLYISCFGSASTYDSDPRNHAFNEGARSVLLRIMNLSKVNIIK